MAGGSTKGGFFTDDLFLRHDTGPHHPESPARLIAIRNRLEKTVLNRFQFLDRRDATPADIALIHDIRYVTRLEAFCKKDGGYLDGDTPVSRDSFNAAMLAAGCGLQAADEIKSGKIDRALLLVRPPGHHSLAEGAMGFCLFNNVAICARYLQTIGFKRPAIIDWDVHHGNGTQDVFYEDPTVLFISLHQFPFYPGSGSAKESGSGAGQGFTLNVPMPAGSMEAKYRTAFSEQIIPKLEQYSPDVILISAGFDAHMDDPLAQINLTASSFEWMTQSILQFANQACQGRVISFLEGGYNLQALADSVEAHAAALLG